MKLLFVALGLLAILTEARGKEVDDARNDPIDGGEEDETDEHLRRSHSCGNEETEIEGKGKNDVMQRHASAACHRRETENASSQRGQESKEEEEKKRRCFEKYLGLFDVDEEHHCRIYGGEQSEIYGSVAEKRFEKFFDVHGVSLILSVVYPYTISYM